MPPETVPEWGEAELQEFLQEQYGALAESAREAVSEWFARGEGAIIIDVTVAGKTERGIAAIESALLPPSGSVPLSPGSSIVAYIRSNPIGVIA